MANVYSAQYISETYIVWECVYKRTHLRCAGHISNMPAQIKDPFYSQRPKRCNARTRHLEKKKQVTAAENVHIKEACKPLQSFKRTNGH